MATTYRGDGIYVGLGNNDDLFTELDGSAAWVKRISIWNDDDTLAFEGQLQKKDADGNWLLLELIHLVGSGHYDMDFYPSMKFTHGLRLTHVSGSGNITWYLE